MKCIYCKTSKRYNSGVCIKCAQIAKQKYRRKPQTKIKEAKYAREYKLKNKLYFFRYNKKYRNKNKEYFRLQRQKRRNVILKNVGNFDIHDINKIYKKQEGICVYCKKTLGTDYHIDHKTPITRGGSNFPKNLQVTCPSCNRKKNTKTHEEFLKLINQNKGA